MTSADFRTAFFGAAGALIVLITFVAINAAADSDPGVDTVPRVIPYDGVLELDGGAYTGAISMRFTLYDNTDSSTGWTETYTLDGDAAAQVDVYNGTFTRASRTARRHRQHDSPRRGTLHWCRGQRMLVGLCRG